MRLSVIAASCAALSLAACAGGPAALVEGVQVLNDGCDRVVKATMTYAAPMPPSGTVEITKKCYADKRRALVEGAEIPSTGAP